ncbi:MAG: polymerase subunit sigma-24 [Pseudonocardiales bacterium]|nr:polymerase subunit sigma-24 [Pseudonocardiales bacterium]
MTGTIERATHIESMSGIYARHSGRCLRVALGVTRDHHFAQDAVQEAFLSYAQGPHRFDSERGSLGGWLATLSHRRAVDIVRRESVRPRPSPLVQSILRDRADGDHGPEARALASFTAGQVEAALSRLDAGKQRIIRLAYYYGYSQSQIASALGVPLGTVKARNRAALQELRAWL